MFIYPPNLRTLLLCQYRRRRSGLLLIRGADVCLRRGWEVGSAGLNPREATALQERTRGRLRPLPGMQIGQWGRLALDDSSAGALAWGAAHNILWGIGVEVHFLSFFRTSEFYEWPGDISRAFPMTPSIKRASCHAVLVQGERPRLNS